MRRTVSLQTYLARREKLKDDEIQFREVCLNCRQVRFNCFCHYVQKLNTDMKFIILMHPMEARRRVASGRMAHLCLENSELITTYENRGHDYGQNKNVNAILQNSDFHSVLLYPGATSTNLTYLKSEDRKLLVPKGKRLAVFVVDGTWNTARKTVRLSANINSLPRICFSPPRPSQFLVRKQPNASCFSTIEAIHETIELLGDVQNRDHDKLLYVFDKLVQRQLEYVKISNPRHTRYKKAI